MAIALELMQSPTDDVVALVAELDAELNAAYEPQNRHGYDIARIFRPDVLFFIAHLDGAPAGCGAIDFNGGIAEVKRMYVRPAARGRGVAQAMLARLESEARARHFSQLNLETGDAQQSALRLYERAGFTRCAAFGPYLKLPLSATARSIFHEKPLA